ncbi:MAG: MBL fold metallo-hydrolase [Halanaerobiales bacterium]
MKMTVLGARGAYPGKNEGCSGYLIQENGFNLLLDCGSGVVSALQNYIELIELDAVVLSHYHADHWSDIGVLQHGIMIICKVSNNHKNLPIYGPRDNESPVDLNYKSYTAGRPYRENRSLTLGPFTIEFLKTKHSIPCFAVKITSGETIIVYTADTAYFKELAGFSYNADLLIAESTLYPETNGQKLGHMNSTDAARLAEKAGSGELLLSHLPNYGDNNILLKDAGKHFNGKIRLAASGYRWAKSDS